MRRNAIDPSRAATVRAPFAVVLSVALLFLLATPAFAHRVSSVSLVSRLDTKERTYVLEAAMEVVPSEDAAQNDQISPEDAAREFSSYLVVMFDRVEQEPAMEIAEEETSDADTPPELRRQQVITTLSGKIPEGAGEFLLYLDPRCPMAVVMVVLKADQPDHRMQVVLAGEYSRPVSVALVVEGDPFEAGNAEASSPAPMPTAAVASGKTALPAPFLAGWRAFLHESALPVALVVAMFLLSLGRADLLRQAGTLLAAQGSVAALAAWSLLPTAAWAGPALVALVAALAIEALLHRQVRGWRYGLVAAAGVALGCFLAGTPSFRGFVAAGDAGAGRVGLLLLGIGAAFVLVGLATAAVLLPLGRFEWYRKSVVAPLAVLVAGYAIFTAVERWL